MTSPLFVDMNNFRNEATIMAIGKTGSGKSLFLSRFLGEEGAFESFDRPTPGTSDPSYKSKDINGSTFYAIDTEGFEDGFNNPDSQITKLVRFMRKWDKGVNVLAIVLNGMESQFDEIDKNILTFVCNSFQSPMILKHIAIIFTRCFEKLKSQNIPNRDLLNAKKELIISHLKEKFNITDLNNINVPTYFIDSADKTGETQSNIDTLRAVVLFHDPIDTSQLSEPCFREVISIEKEYDSPLSKEERIGNETYAWFADKMRKRYKPYNGDKESYGEWVITKEYKKLVSKDEVEEEDFFVREERDGDKIIGVYDRKRRTKTIFFNGNPSIYSEWVREKSIKKEIGEYEYENKIKVFQDYEYSGDSRSALYYDLERENKRYYETKTMKCGDWKICKSYSEDAGKIKRIKKTQTKSGKIYSRVVKKYKSGGIFIFFRSDYVDKQKCYDEWEEYWFDVYDYDGKFEYSTPKKRGRSRTVIIDHWTEKC